jgi:hypothetical protein
VRNSGGRSAHTAVSRRPPRPSDCLSFKGRSPSPRAKPLSSDSHHPNPNPNPNPNPQVVHAAYEAAKAAEAVAWVPPKMDPAVQQVRFLRDAESSLGDAKSSLGDAKSSLGDVESSLGDAKSSLG